MQNRKITLGAADVDTHTLNIDYRYNMINQQFGIEANLFSKDPSPGDSTEAYRISAYWTYNFDRPPVATRPVTQAGQPLPAAVEAKATVAGLAPGFTVDKIQAALQRDGISGGVKQAGYIVYEHPLLADVFQRQRMVLQYEAGTLERSALIIDFDDVGNRDSVTQTFERIRQELIRQLGTPTRTFQEGDFTESFVSDVNEQRLIRITEWETDRGTIRFGIPRRLDRQVRMEIQYARSFPQPRDTLWSIEAVR